MFAILQTVMSHAMMLVYNLIISKDIWLVGHGVVLRDGADDFAWAACGE